MRYTNNKNFIYKYTLQIILGLSVASFFIGFSCFAAFNEQFEKYQLGSMNGQGSWSITGGTDKFNNVNTFYYSATTSLQLNTGASCSYDLAEGMDVSGRVDFYIYIATTSGDYIQLTPHAAARDVFYFKFSCLSDHIDTYFDMGGGGGPELAIGGLDYSTWYKVSWMINYTDRDVAYSLDDGGWLYWDIVGAGDITITDLKFETTNLNAAAYIDDIITSLEFNNSDIYFVVPADTNSYALNTFYWQVAFSIGYEDQITYYGDRIYAYINYLPPNSVEYVAASESGLIALQGYIEDFGIDDYNSWRIDEDLFIPPYRGDYEATATLVVYHGGDIVTLAEAGVSFTLATSTYETILSPKTGWCSDICDDLQPSLTNPFDYFTCAGRHIVCYAFTPHSFSVGYIKDKYEDLQGDFPFSIFYDITSTTKNAIIEAEEEDSQAFPLIVKQTISEGGELYTIDIFSTSTTADLIGEENNEIWRSFIGSIFWILIIILIVLEIKAFIK